YQPIWRPCPPRRNEFQGLPAYLLHLLFQHSRDVRFFRTAFLDRKSTRLNSSHVKISYAVFCLKKKTSSTNRKKLTSSSHALALTQRNFYSILCQLSMLFTLSCHSFYPHRNLHSFPTRRSSDLYQPTWRPCPPRRNEFQGLPAYLLHLLFQHSLDVRFFQTAF